MWRISFVVLAILGSTSLLSAASGQTISPESSLPNQLDWARFEIILGRLQPGACNSTKSRTRTLVDADAGVRQSYRVSPSGSTVAVEYECISEQSRLKIHFDEAAGLVLESVKAGVELKLTQSVDGEVTVTVEPGGFRTEAPGLWRLALQEPALMRLHIEPAFRTLRKDWRFTSFMECVERQLPRAVRASTNIIEREIEQRVRALGDDSFAVRREARIGLVELGSGIIPILKQVDPFQLNSEQSAQLDAVCEELTPIVGDSPGRVAFFIAGDRNVWIAMLNHDNRMVRMAAADHLATLCGASFPFDADAEGLARQIQFSRLRDTLAAGTNTAVARQ